jgi:hypothetical protein
MLAKQLRLCSTLQAKGTLLELRGLAVVFFIY